MIRPGINMAPLLDAIFNLVFFFLLATTIRTEEYRTDIHLPPSGTATARRDEIPAIEVDKEGGIYFQGRKVVIEELELELIHLRDEGEATVMIRGDEEADFGRIYELLDLCRRIGLGEASFETRRKPGEAGP